MGFLEPVKCIMSRLGSNNLNCIYEELMPGYMNLALNDLKEELQKKNTSGT